MIDQIPDEHQVVGYDRMAEESALGAMLLDATVIDNVTDQITPADLYYPAHEAIAQAIVGLHRAGKPSDVIAVTAELERTGTLGKAGGPVKLHSLTSAVTTPKSAGYWAELIRRAAVLRRMAHAGARIQQLGQAGEGDVDEILEHARASLDGVAARQVRTVRSVGESLDELAADLRAEPVYFETPWAGLNKLISGFAPGGLSIVAARPAGGKSVALLQIARGLAHRGTVAYCSLEMTEAELQKRLVAQYGEIHMTSLRDHKLSPDDWSRFEFAKKQIAGAPIFFDDTAAVTLSQIRSHARAVARRGKLSGIVVDYLQLVRGEGDSRQESVAAVSRGLKQLAKDLRVPVIAAAQLRRAGLGAKNELPTIEDLRESGSIEQDADVVILLHRDAVKAPNDLQMIVAKNRSGPSGRFTLTWQAQFARLVDRGAFQPALIDEREVG